MAALSDDVKAFVVQALACFDTPSQVAEAVKDEFGLVIPRQQVALYDPTKATGKNLANKWRHLFEATRDEWRKGVTEVPIANRVFRLRALDRMAVKAERMRNLPLAVQIHKQAAQEVGDVYVNKGRAGGDAAGGEEPVATKVVRGVKDARRYDDG